jgi:hypothetical protein
MDLGFQQGATAASLRALQVRKIVHPAKVKWAAIGASSAKQTPS